MPRKYRPPDSRRRKPRRTASPHIFEQPIGDGVPPSDGVGAAALDEAPTAPAPAPVARLSASQPSRATSTRHISKDYGYVRGEIGRIVLVAGFLIASLVITAILRN